MLRQQLPSTATLYDTLSNSIGWLKPNNIKASVVNNGLLLSATLLTLIAEASATECFETPDAKYPTLHHDTALMCLTTANSERDLVQGLYDHCGAFSGVQGQDFLHDACPHLFSQSIEFGKGLFAGAQCTLSLHQDDILLDPIQINPCVVNYLNDNVKDGFGTVEDGLITAAIVIGGVAVLGCLAKCTHTLFKMPAPTSEDKASLLENGPSEVTPTGIEETETPKPSMA